MEYEINIELGDLGTVMGLVSALVDGDGGVTLIEVYVFICGVKTNVRTMLTDNSRAELESEYLSRHEDDSKSIGGRHLYDEHDFS